MELPTEIKSLYRHWERHLLSTQPRQSLIEQFSDPKFFLQIEQFILERTAIWKSKQINQTPYTQDPILSKYRFCNIFRELDKQTITFHKLLNPLRDDFPLWLMNMFMCRMIARPETIEQIGLLSFDESTNNHWMNSLLNTPIPKYGNAYVFPISTIQNSSTPTREQFLAQHLPAVIKLVAKEISTWNKQSVFDGIQKIFPIFGFNHSFLWTEVLIDVAYQFPDKIDLFTRFPIGPGSLPTIKQINSSVDSSLIVSNLAKGFIDLDLTVNNVPLRLSAENWEGIGCEFRKYTNLSAGHGRKRLYYKK